MNLRIFIGSTIWNHEPLCADTCAKEMIVAKKAPAPRMVLWGINKKLSPDPIKISGGNQRECNAEKKRRENDLGPGVTHWEGLKILPEGAAYE